MDLGSTPSDATTDLEGAKDVSESGLPRRSKLKGENQFGNRLRRRAGSPLGSPRGPGSPRSGRSPRQERGKRRHEMREQLAHRGLRSPASSAQGGRSARSEQSARVTKKRKGKMGDEVPKARLGPMARCLDCLNCVKRLRRGRDAILGWRAQRRESLNELWELVNTLDEEEQNDTTNIDEFGNPVKADHTLPKGLRLRIRFYRVAYYAPLIDLFDRCPSTLRVLRTISLLVPLLGFLTAGGWLVYSIYWNSLYDEGACYVEVLPPAYEDTAEVESKVSGQYTVRRVYPPTSDRPGGSVLQECKVVVPCDKASYGSTGGESERCVIFRTWSLGEQMTCFYHQDDFYGDENMELFCLQRPSNLEREFFTLAIAGVILACTILICAVMAWRRRDYARQMKAAEAMAAKEAREFEEAKLKIEEREMEEVKRMKEKLDAQMGAEGDEGSLGSSAEDYPSDDDGEDEYEEQ